MKVFGGLVAALSTLLLVVFTPARADQVILVGGIVDGIADERLGEHTLRIRDGVIISIEAGLRPESVAEEDALIDLREHTVLPGLMDLHTHLTSQFGANVYLERFRHNEADVAIRGVDYARRTLMAGFTTVRDLGDRFNASVALRNAINGGIVAGPRIFTSAKSLATTGGHADPTNGWAKHLGSRTPGPTQGVINGPQQAQQAVRQRYKDGADLIKVTATGGVLSLASSGQNAQFTDAELAAIIETASDYGFHVAAHAHGKEGMLRAVNAGVHSIEHGTYMDDEVMRAMKRKGTYYVPTLVAGKWVAEKSAVAGFFPAAVVPKAASIGPQIQETFAAAYAAGVKIAFGTDTGVSPHGENGREFALMVEAGMPPMEAIQSATRVAAEFLGIDDRLGTLAVGKTADIIAVGGDPVADVTQLERVAFVMKEGRVYKAP